MIETPTKFEESFKKFRENGNFWEIWDECELNLQKILKHITKIYEEFEENLGQYRRNWNQWNFKYFKEFLKYKFYWNLKESWQKFK